jgi:hypothetical protein
MTEQELEEQTLKAFAARRKHTNAQLQYLKKDGQWEDIVNPGWIYNMHYRIKPSPKRSTWTMEQAIGRTVRRKDGEFPELGLITSASKDNVFISGGQWISYRNLLDNYETIDGKPCGVLEE